MYFGLGIRTTGFRTVSRRGLKRSGGIRWRPHPSGTRQYIYINTLWKQPCKLIAFSYKKASSGKANVLIKVFLEQSSRHIRWGQLSLRWLQGSPATQKQVLLSFFCSCLLYWYDSRFKVYMTHFQI